MNDFLSSLWSGLGHDPGQLDRVRLHGGEPALPSSFAVGTLAQTSIAATAAAAAVIHEKRGGPGQDVSVSMRHAAIEFQSEKHFRLDGEKPKGFRDPLAGIYRCQDGNWIRPHLNFPHHRAGFCAVLGCPDSVKDKETFAGHFLRWNSFDLEQRAAEAGLPVCAMRDFATWDAHPQAAFTAAQPLVRVEKIADCPPTPLPEAACRPLEHLRVLDLTRVIAGPVCGRVMAAHGAEVLAVSAAHLPSVRQLVIDTNRGKRTCHIDLRERHEVFTSLLAGADVMIQSYRPGALSAIGLGPHEAARIRPGIVYGELSAFGPDGPWAGRRGYDSLTQTATGFNHAEAEAANDPKPRELPSQALDHATGYLLALGVMTALLRRATEGGSWRVYVSLARTGLWLRSMGRIDGFAEGLEFPAPESDMFEARQSGFGYMEYIRHAAQMSMTPARWELPVMPLGSHEPRWSE